MARNVKIRPIMGGSRCACLVGHNPSLYMTEWHSRQGCFQGRIQDFVLGGHTGMGMGACPSKLARVSGKAQ